MTQFVNGFDVSHWQGNIDWPTVARAGMAFAFAKASDGASVGDSEFKRNWDGMKDAGLLRGAYFYYEVGQDPKAQAENFIKHAPLGAGDLPPVIDIEHETAGAESDANLRADLHACIDALKARYGASPILYTGPSFWNAHFDDSYSDCPLWVAEYGVSKPKPVTGWGYWSFWQYSQSGKVAGIDGDVDLDYFNGGLDQLKRFLLS